MPRQAQPHYEDARNQWYIYVNYKKKYLCSGKGNWAKAAREAERILGRPLDPGPARTVAQTIEQWCMRHGGDWERARLTPFNQYAGGLLLSEVTEGLLEQYLEHLRRRGYSRTYRKKGHDPRVRQFKYANKTLRAMVSLAHRVLEWASRPPRRMLDIVPALPALPEPRKGYRDVPRPRLRSAFASLPARARPLLEFIVLTGCRPNEGCTLEWGQLDLEAGIARIEKHKTGDATGEDRILYLSPHALAVINAQPRDGRYVFPKKSGQPYRPSGLRSILRRRGINGGYALRHTYAQFALESGVSLEVVQKHLGHKHISTTQTYAQVRDPQAVQAAQALPSLLQAPPPDEPARETGVGESRELQTANQSNPRRRSRAPARRKAAPRGASRRQSA